MRRAREERCSPSSSADDVLVAAAAGVLPGGGRSAGVIEGSVDASVGKAGGGAAAATGGGTDLAPVAAGRPGLPTGRISSFSRSLPRLIQTLSRSTEERNAPGSISSFSRNPFGSFMPFAQRTARLAEGVEDTIVPTRTNRVRVAWEPVFGSTAGSRDAIFIPSPGAKRLAHSSGGAAGTPGPAEVAPACAVPFGEYASRPRIRVMVTPSETAATTMETPNMARWTGFRMRSPGNRM